MTYVIIEMSIVAHLFFSNIVFYLEISSCISLEFSYRYFYSNSLYHNLLIFLTFGNTNILFFLILVSISILTKQYARAHSPTPTQAHSHKLFICRICKSFAFFLQVFWNPSHKPNFLRLVSINRLYLPMVAGVILLNYVSC